MSTGQVLLKWDETPQIDPERSEHQAFDVKLDAVVLDQKEQA